MRCALIASFPIEDIWLLEPARAKECHLDKPVNLIAIVIEGLNLMSFSTDIEELMRKRPDWSRIDVFVLSARPPLREFPGLYW